jgi:glycosyltransferase involved in cell wall biosynthesis
LGVAVAIPTLPEEFILFVGTVQPRKNIEGLIEAFRILKEEFRLPHSLVITGCKGWEYSEVFKRIDAYGLNDKVKWIGYVDYKDLPALYSMADVFVLPSYYEGFGLPIIEAMACGTPVITSNVSSMPEVAGDAAIFIDFTWDKCAADTMAAFEEVVSRREKGTVYILY